MRTVLSAIAVLGLLFLAITPAAHAQGVKTWTGTVTFTGTDTTTGTAYSFGLWDFTSANWTGSLATSTTFANGDAVVFGSSTSAATTGTTIYVAGVTVASQTTATGTNPGMIVGSGSWNFIGGAIAGGNIEVNGTTGLSFSSQNFVNRSIVVDANSSLVLSATDNASIVFNATTGTSGVTIPANGGAIRTATDSDLGFAFIGSGSTTIGKYEFAQLTATNMGGAIYAGGNLTMSGSGLVVNFAGNKVSNSTYNYSSGAYVSGTFNLTNGAILAGEGGFAAQAFNFSNASIAPSANASNVEGNRITLTLIDASGAPVAGDILFDNMTVSANNGNLATHAGNDITIGGTLTLLTNVTTGLNIGSISSNLNGSGEVVKNGLGIMILSGSNTYSGSTTINSGTLMGNIADNSTLTISASAAYFSATSYVSGTISGVVDRNIAVLNGSGLVDMNGANLTLSAGDFGTGTVRNIATLTKTDADQASIGSGTIGTLNVSQGNLTIGAGQTLTVTGSTLLAASTTLGVSLNANNAPALITNNFNSSGATSVIDINGYGNVTQSGTAASIYVLVQTASANAISGSYTIKQNGNDIGGTPTLNEFLSINEITTDPTKIQIATNLTWLNTAPGSAHGTFYINSGTFTLTADLADNTTTGAPISTWDGKTLTKTGNGTLILSGSNTYSGTTDIQLGTLINTGQIKGDANVAASGTFANSGTIIGNITNAGFFAFYTRSDTTTDSGTTPGTVVPSDTTTIVANPDGSRTTTSITYTSSTVTTATGTTAYIISTTSTVKEVNGRMDGNLANTGTVFVNLDLDYTYNGVLSGSGTSALVWKTGTSAFTLNGGNTFSGSVQIDAGSIRAGKAHILDSAAVYVINGPGALDLGGLNQNLKNVVTNSGLLSFGTAQAVGTPLVTATATIGNYTGTNGFISMRYDSANAKADQIVFTGTTSGTHTIVISSTNTVSPDKRTEIPLIITQSGTDIATAVFTGSAEAGIYIMNVRQGDPTSNFATDPKTWYLAASDRLSNTADALLSTASVSSLEWNYSLDSLRQRMGDVRQEALMAPSEKKTSPLAYTTVSSKGGNLWLRGSAYHLDGDSTITGQAFTEDVYGIDFGIDKTYRWESNQYLLGMFGDISNVSRNFESRGESKTNNYGVGFYFTYLNDNGWYGDTTLRIAKGKNSISAYTIDGFSTDADYSNLSWGVSLEVGRLIKSKKTGWWAEPAAQVSFAVMNGNTYTTSNGIDVKMADADSTQLRATLRAGRDIPNSFFKPYVKVGIATVSTSGGRMRAGTTYFTPNMDGSRFETGAGFSAIIDEKSQLYIEYEYAKASSYQRPWSVNFGYRHTW